MGAVMGWGDRFLWRGADGTYLQLGGRGRGRERIPVYPPVEDKFRLSLPLQAVEDRCTAH